MYGEGRGEMDKRKEWDGMDELQGEREEKGYGVGDGRRVLAEEGATIWEE